MTPLPPNPPAAGPCVAVRSEDLFHMFLRMASCRPMSAAFNKKMSDWLDPAAVPVVVEVDEDGAAGTSLRIPLREPPEYHHLQHRSLNPNPSGSRVVSAHRKMHGT